MKKFLEQLKNGLLFENPLLIQTLGMCSSLAVTTSASNAIGMGLAVTAVLICSNLLISLLRKLIPNQIRIAAYIVIISGFVTAVEMLIKAFFYDLYGALGVFIPLIVVNCIILARAEAFASKNKVLPSAVDGLAMGLGYTIAIFVLGCVREIIGNGTIFGISLFGENYSGAVMVLLPAGAFIMLGCFIAGLKYFVSRSEEKQKARRKAEKKEVANA